MIFDGIELIIFDCDGILVDSEPLALRVNAGMLAELGWHLSDDEIIDRFVGRSMTSNVAVVEAHLGRTVPADWVQRFHAEISAAHERELIAVAGIAEALEEIAGWDVQICVASSGIPDRVRHSLELCGLDPYFGDRIFSATQVAHGKPAPDLFLFAASSLGVAPSSAVVVEDSQYGVEAARAADMHVF
ncbi:MAG TPA: HAD family hydrolase, partial [Micromonosporaceae bacterium]